MSGNAGFGFCAYTLNNANSNVCARVLNNSGDNTTHKLSQNGPFAFSPTASVPGAGVIELEPSTGTFTTVGPVNNVPAGACGY